MSEARMKAIRSRVLDLLDAAGAGDVANWRDRNAGYWIGVEEGRYDAEAEADRLRRRVAVLEGRLARVLELAAESGTIAKRLRRGGFYTEARRGHGRVWSRSRRSRSGGAK